MDPTDALSDANTLQVIADNYGLPGMVLFSVALFLGFLAWVIKSGPAWIKAIRGDKDRDTPVTQAPSRSRTPESIPDGVGEGTWGIAKAISAGKIRDIRDTIPPEKDRTDEKQDSEIVRLRDEIHQFRSKLDDAFTVMGKVREEIKEARAELREANEKLDAKIEKQRDKCDATNRDQSRDIKNNATTINTLQGMVMAKRTGGSSGVTQFIKDEDKS